MLEARPIQVPKPQTMVSRFSAFFMGKPANIALDLSYELLPKTYRDTSALSLSDLVTHWESLASAPQKSALTPVEQKFILSSLLYPNRGILSLESLSLSPEARINVWFFIEQLLTYNPHITDITMSTEWEIPLSTQTQLNKNQQWKAALYYATIPRADYNALDLPLTVSEIKQHRKQLAIAYKKTVLPWIKETLKCLKSTLPSEDILRLKQHINETYLPIIQKMATYHEIGSNFRSKSYADVFKSCKPNDNAMLHAQIRAESLGFR